MKQTFNPYLPSYEYIPDAEPHIFNDRVYIYGSHDKFNGGNFCLLDYVCYSAPLDDLTSWRYEGVIFRRSQDPACKKGFNNALYAPDVVQGLDGKYYLYYFVATKGYIAVAVCSTPAGQFEYLGKIKYSDGTMLGKKGEPIQFDPAVFIDDDGKIFLYTGFSPYGVGRIILLNKKPATISPMCFELESDMLTIKNAYFDIGVKTKYNSKNTNYINHEFFEASSMRKFDGKYYFIYSTTVNHELAYAVSNYPNKNFQFGGVLVSNGDVGIDNDIAKNYTGNNHGSIVKILDEYYVFYHRHTNRHWCSRQACAEKIKFVNGKFVMAELTSCGLNNTNLQENCTYEARIACRLYSKRGTYGYLPIKLPKSIHPYFTQTGEDRNENGDQYIANFTNGATAVYKYFDILNTTKISIDIISHAKGKMLVYANDTLASQIIIDKKGRQTFSSTFCGVTGKVALKFVFVGSGKLDFLTFTLA